MPKSKPVNEAIVTTLLAQAGLRVSRAELESLARGYDDHRAAVESLYLVKEARYGSPCLNFEPNPDLVDW